MASALNNIKSRLGPLMKIHAVNLIGGASRIPMIQNIVSECFQM
jgi:molecular chaperone DnaK (HSP70)